MFDIVLVAANSIADLEDISTKLKTIINKNTLILVSSNYSIYLESVVSSIHPFNLVYCIYSYADVRLTQEGVYNLMSSNTDTYIGRSVQRDLADTKRILDFISLLDLSGIASMYKQDLRDLIWMNLITNICYDHRAILYGEYDVRKLFSGEALEQNEAVLHELLNVAKSNGLESPMTMDSIAASVSKYCHSHNHTQITHRFLFHQECHLDILAPQLLSKFELPHFSNLHSKLLEHTNQKFYDLEDHSSSESSIEDELKELYVSANMMERQDTESKIGERTEQTKSLSSYATLKKTSDSLKNSIKSNASKRSSNSNFHSSISLQEVSTPSSLTSYQSIPRKYDKSKIYNSWRSKKSLDREILGSYDGSGMTEKGAYDEVQRFVTEEKEDL